MKNLFTACFPNAKGTPIVGEVGDKLPAVRGVALTGMNIVYLLNPDNTPNGGLQCCNPAYLARFGNQPGTPPWFLIPGTESLSQDMFADLPESMTATVVSVGEITMAPGRTLRALAVSFDGMDEYFKDKQPCEDCYPKIPWLDSAR